MDEPKLVPELLETVARANFLYSKEIKQLKHKNKVLETALKKIGLGVLEPEEFKNIEPIKCACSPLKEKDPEYMYLFGWASAEHEYGELAAKALKGG